MSTRAVGRNDGRRLQVHKECRVENMTTERRSLEYVPRDGARKRKGPQPKFLEQRQLNEQWNRKAQKLFHKNAHFKPGWSRDSRAIVSIKCQVTPCSDSFTNDARCTSREPERDRYCVAQHEKTPQFTSRPKQHAKTCATFNTANIMCSWACKVTATLKTLTASSSSIHRDSQTLFIKSVGSLRTQTPNSLCGRSPLRARFVPTLGQHDAVECGLEAQTVLWTPSIFCYCH